MKKLLLSFGVFIVIAIVATLLYIYCDSYWWMVGWLILTIGGAFIYGVIALICETIKRKTKNYYNP